MPAGLPRAGNLGNQLGNALGRLTTPQAATTTTTLPKILAPVGSLVTMVSGDLTKYFPSLGANAGMIGSSIAVVNTTMFDGTNYIQRFYAFNVSATSGASLINFVSTGTGTASNMPLLTAHSCFSSGNAIYFNNNGTLYSVTVSGSTVSYATVKASYIPSSGTLTVGGSAYTLVGNTWVKDVDMYLGDNTLNGTPDRIIDLGDGTGMAIKMITVSSNYYFAAFVINSSGNIVKSQLISPALTSYSTTGAVYQIFKTGTSQYSLFCGYNASSPYGGFSCAFDIAAGTVTNVLTYISGVRPAGTPYTGFSTMIGSGNLYIFAQTTTPDTNKWIFPINANLTPSSSGSITVQPNTTPTNYYSRYKSWDIQYSDFVVYGDSGVTTFNPNLDPPVVDQNSSSAKARVNTFDAEALTLNASGASVSISYTRPKSLQPVTQDNTSSSAAPYKGPIILTRFGSNAFLMMLEDQTSTTRSQYVQVYAAA